ncbi:MFS transporter [Streptomyces sp. SCSIO ZS0520]|uniref:MFS transporter n=1 Tax=Streptomyces sp. SCSIO ZS0520 TaxID=2892996 RepID=UPI0021D8751F|nr:MFS transporter [Streptomyces sp. SCSIO ZS0520]
MGNHLPRPAPGPYRRLFSAPGATAFTAGSLLARLPMGMSGVSLVLMVAGTRGSYALAGAVSAVGLGVTAVVAPLIARLVDRHGQARIAIPAVALSASASAVLVLCVRREAPDWTLFASYAATSCAPNTGGMARARWSHLYRQDPAARHVANSFEQVADEACFMLGPVLAAFLCTALFPEAGTLAGAALLLSGVLLFCAQRGTQPPTGSGTARGRAPLRTAGMPGVLLTFVCTGVIFGALEVTTLAFAEARGHRGAGGALLALQAAGSCAAGLLLGLRAPAASLPRRFARCTAAMAALTTLPLLARDLPVLACCLFLTGCASAPAMVTGITLVQSLVPEDRLNEGMTLAVTGILTGISAGAAAAGWTAEHLRPGSGYWIPCAAATLAALTARLRAARSESPAPAGRAQQGAGP